MCIQGMMGQMENMGPVDEKTIEGALAHAGATLANQNEALLGEVARRMIFGPSGFEEYIWYKGKEAHCTACGQEFPTPRNLRHNEPARCPSCGRGVTTKNARLGHTRLRQEFYCVEWRKSAVEKNALVMIGFYCNADYRRAERVEKMVVPVLLDVFRYGKGAQRFQRSAYNEFLGTVGQCSWGRRRDVRSISRGYFGGKPFDVLENGRNFADAIAGTPFKSAHETMIAVEQKRGLIYMGERSELIAAIARRPWMEYMAKAGFEKIAYTARYSIPRGLVNERGKNLRAILKLSPDRYAELRGRKADPSPGLLEIIQRGDRDGAKLRYAEAEAINEMLSRTFVRDELLKGRTLDRQFARYILRLKSPADLSTLRDYWDAARAIGLDLSDMETRFPRNLNEAHDRAVEARNELRRAEAERRYAEQKRRRAEEQETSRKKLEKRMPGLERKYCFSANGLILRPARDAAELIAEGNALHHCVGGYVRRYADGGTDICFLRRADAPDKPWRTVEIDPKSGNIIQDRGAYNDRRNGQSTITPELRAELDAFWAAFAEFSEAGKLKKAV